MDESKNFPTMIIPAGTEIAVNEQGQLSIRTPGNLVIQNSGVYSVIESGSGSVRIDPEVRVEAVSVQAADSCYVAGELTAWRVRANKITLEKGAQANIMLQESESLELDRNARLVGNFASEKELYLMLGRFSRQLRQLPDGLGGNSDSSIPIPAKTPASAPPPAKAPEKEPEEPFVSPDGEDEPGPAQQGMHGEVLSLARVVIQKELGRPQLHAAGKQALEKLLELVRSQDSSRLGESYAYLISQVAEPSEDLEKIRGMLKQLFSS